MANQEPIVRDENTRGKKKWTDEQNAQAAEKIAQEMMGNGKDPMEGKLVAVKWGKTGPIPYVRENGKDVAKPIPDKAWADFQGDFKERDMNPLHWIIDATNQIEQLPNRQLPLLMDEFLKAGFKEKDFRRLCNLNLVSKHLIGVVDQKRAKQEGKKAKPSMSKVAIYLSPMGKGYMKHLQEITNAKKS
jgi:hypothetical protein